MSLGTFRTKRLRVVDWTPELSDPDRQEALLADLQALLKPAVLAPLPPSFALQVGEAGLADWVAARDAESAVSLIRLHRGDLVGLLILANEQEGCHVGYLFAETAWGRGYATEMLAGLVQEAERQGTDLIAGVGPDNPASARVLRKAGFTRDGAASSPEADVYVRPAHAD